MDEVAKNVKKTEKATGKKFGDARKPLLLSVRSGAAVSMPGMMDTVLNLGLTDEIVEAMAESNDRFAYDSYRRLINMYGDVVVGVHHHHFEEAISKMKADRGVKEDTELTADDLKKLCGEYKKVFKKHAGFAFPQDPMGQLELAIEAVFKSWDSDKAKSYRRAEGMGHYAGTAVNCQTMVFGNMGDDCATGVGFTRDPSTGENKLYCDYLINAQGEDVVAGIRTPKDALDMKKELPGLHKEDHGHAEAARGPLQGRAGLRVHRRAGHAVHAANPQRQADRPGGAEDRDRPAQGKDDRRKGGRPDGHARPPRPVAAPGLRPGSPQERPGADQRPQRLARRGRRQARLHRRGRQAACRGRRSRAARAS